MATTTTTSPDRRFNPRLTGMLDPQSGIVLALSAAVAALLAVPILSVGANLFAPSGPVWQHLIDTVLIHYVSNSAILALGVGVGVAALGIPTAWVTTMYRFPGRGFFEWALILPLAFPAYVVAYTYTDFLQFSGPVQTALRETMGWSAADYWFPEIRSVGGAALILSLVLYPYVYLLARASFLEQSVCALEVSRSLGHGPLSTFTRIALPLARPAIAAGIALALMETLADYGTVSYFSVQTFTTGIYRTWFSLGDPIAASKLAACLLIFILAILSLESLSRRGAHYHHTSKKYRRLGGDQLGFWPGIAATTLCAFPVLFGFVLPLTILANLGLEIGFGGIDGRFLTLVGNTITLGSLAALLVVSIAALLTFGVRLYPHIVTRFAHRLAGMGYAIPGSVIAVGILVPLGFFDNTLDEWARSTFGISTGLLLTGSIGALLFAYAVRFAAVALQTTNAAFSKISSSLDNAARVLGAKPGRLLFQVHVPIMRGSLLTAALIVFVEVVKELPATVIMRPFNFDTLAVSAHNLAADERLNEAALPAIAIVLVGILPVIIMARAISRARPGTLDEKSLDGFP